MGISLYVLISHNESFQFYMTQVGPMLMSSSEGPQNIVKLKITFTRGEWIKHGEQRIGL